MLENPPAVAVSSRFFVPFVGAAIFAATSLASVALVAREAAFSPAMPTLPVAPPPSFASPSVSVARERQFRGEEEAQRVSSPSSASFSSASSAASFSTTVLSLPQVRDEVRRRSGKGMLALRRVPSPVLHAAPVRRHDNAVAMYLSAGSAGRKDFASQTVDRTLEAGGNAVVVGVKGGKVFFATTSPMAEELGTIAPTMDLPVFVDTAHEKGLYVIARFVAAKDDPLALKLPSTRVRNAKTGAWVNTGWTDPGAKDTLEYNRQILSDLLASGIDEVNFDYIRFNGCPLSVVGMTGAEKAERVEKFLRMARREIDAKSPRTKLGISTYAILGWDYQINADCLGQDVVRFAPLVDVISPMAYPSSFTDPAYYNPARESRSRAYTLVYKTLKGYEKFLGPEHAAKLRPWLQAYSMASNEIKDEILATYDAGFCGYQFWNANNVYGPAYDGLELARGARPERCM